MCAGIMQQDNNEQVILEPKLIAKQYIRHLATARQNVVFLNPSISQHEDLNLGAVFNFPLGCFFI
jgi:hypothetical protein